jgi:hypothetical protein
MDGWMDGWMVREKCLTHDGQIIKEEEMNGWLPFTRISTFFLRLAECECIITGISLDGSIWHSSERLGPLGQTVTPYSIEKRSVYSNAQ